MPVIKKSADLRNKYSEISAFCHKYMEPIFITKNGEGDLAVMSIETYEALSGKNELYKLLQEGIDDIKNGRTLTEAEIIKNMDTALGK
ncbi:type II toxin-antitoxin system prevent-host-death family antitoxin [Treponema primitia]|uniref:type II toxin-antitoxin system prevent-host-death family antitoxin n=1 Tax=Treponema primitia TaxID=88058 RepID=UPI00025552F7|nr:type II toxin-antitoxin system prevent-host-death family antitoxin [Treponema primitia]